MILRILEHTPTWVWVLFCALGALGLAQTRTRDVGRARAILLPLVMMVLSLSAVLNSFTQVPLALVAWVAGLWLALSVGAETMVARGASWSPETRRFRIPGSWRPMTMIMGLFVIKYVAGICLAINPSLAASTLVTTLLSVTYGAFAGLFWSRARSLLRLTRSSQTGQPAAAM